MHVIPCTLSPLGVWADLETLLNQTLDGRIGILNQAHLDMGTGKIGGAERLLDLILEGASGDRQDKRRLVRRCPAAGDAVSYQ